MVEFFTILFLTLGILHGCGSTSSKAGSHSSGSTNADSMKTASESMTQKEASVDITAQLVNTSQDLGVCDSTTQGELKFVRDEQIFYYCDSGIWTSIDLHGPKGTTGAQGPQGATGQKGSDAIYKLYDADNKLIGVAPNFSSSNFDVIHNDSGYPIPVKTLATGFDIGKYASYSICFYESNDCSGKCWIRSSSKDKPSLNFSGVVGIPNLKDEKLSSELIFESVAENSTGSEARAGLCYSACSNCTPTSYKMMGTDFYDPKIPFHVP